MFLLQTVNNELRDFSLDILLVRNSCIARCYRSAVLIAVFYKHNKVSVLSGLKT